MFTGIVQHLGRIASVEPQSFGAAVQVDSLGWSHHPNQGESIAVNGCCLTVASAPGGGALRFDVIDQTLRTTTLGELSVGCALNLEHAVTPRTMLGGHLVQGHVDGVGVIESVSNESKERRLRVKPLQPALMECIVEKGSIAVDGVSLTIAQCGDQWFEIALIPTTIAMTNLGQVAPGDRVNLETDYIAKVVVNWLRRGGRPQ